MEREARESATKEGEPAPLSREKKRPMALAPRGRKRKKEARRDSSLSPSLLLRPTISTGAEETTLTRSSRSRKVRRGRGRGEKKGSVIRSVRRHHLHHPTECIQISLYASLLQTPENRTHSSVGGAGLEGPAPSAIAKGWKRRRGGKRGVEKGKRTCWCLSLRRRKKVKRDRGASENPPSLFKVFSFRFFHALPEEDRRAFSFFFCFVRLHHGGLFSLLQRCG